MKSIVEDVRRYASPIPKAQPGCGAGALRTHRRCSTRRAVAEPQLVDAGAGAGEDLLQILAGDTAGLVSCRPTPLGRGLVAAESVPVRQALVSVPLHNSLVLSDDPLGSISVFGDRWQAGWQETHGPLPPDVLEFLQGSERWDVRLTAWLLYIVAATGADPSGTARKRSRRFSKGQQGGPMPPVSQQLWRQYLSLLPREEDMSCLLNYGPSESHWLQHPRLIAEAKLQHDWIAHLHDRWFSHAGTKGPEGLRLSDSLEQTLWAAAMIRSRTFSENVNGESLTLMVPFADLANHSFTFNTTFCVGRDRQSFELRSLQPLEGGGEVCISYGENKCNAELLRDYGFIVPGNPNDRIPLPGADLLDDDSLSQFDPSITEEGDSGTKGSNTSGIAFGPTVSRSPNSRQGPWLLGAGVVEAAGMTGDWVKSKLQPSTSSGQQDKASWSRRRAAILSFPLFDGYATYGGASELIATSSQDDDKSSSSSSSSPSQGGGGGGLFSWVAKPWTEAGRPEPRQPRGGTEVAAQREAVQQYRSHFSSLMAVLPTTIATDEAMLSAQGAGSTLSPREAAAVRARLEYKLLLQEGLNVLQAYEGHLRRPVTLPGQM